MNKKEMIQELSEKMKLSQAETKVLLDSTFDVLAEILAKGKTVNIHKFGTFSVTKLEKRKGFNPLINKWMMLPPKLRTRFKVSDILKERVNSDEK
jgi:DNA-binding protein HU-beta